MEAVVAFTTRQAIIASASAQFIITRTTIHLCCCGECDIRAICTNTCGKHNYIIAATCIGEHPPTRRDHFFFIGPECLNTEARAILI